MSLVAYIVFIFLIQVPAVFMSVENAETYASIEIFAIGMVAIIIQKVVHRGRFVDMGLRLNRSAIIGLSIALLFSILAALACALLPYWLGVQDYVPNQASALTKLGSRAATRVSATLLLGTVLFFVPCLFGEELAFRGYILPKLDQRFGGAKAVILCAIIFGLWHLPDYYSVYSGGAAQGGLASVALALAGHGISVIPLCILYLTTRELYGVSLYHAFGGAGQYLVLGDETFGDMSKAALYHVVTLNEPMAEVLGWAWQVVGILVMLGLCRFARRWMLRPEMGEVRC